MRKLTSECVSRLSSTCKICKNSCKNLQKSECVVSLGVLNDDKDKWRSVTADKQFYLPIVENRY